MSEREVCAERDCGHDVETHVKETHTTGRLEEPLVTTRGPCTAAWCACRMYVRDRRR